MVAPYRSYSQNHSNSTSKTKKAATGIKIHTIWIISRRRCSLSFGSSFILRTPTFGNGAKSQRVGLESQDCPSIVFYRNGMGNWLVLSAAWVCMIAAIVHVALKRPGDDDE